MFTLELLNINSKIYCVTFYENIYKQFIYDTDGIENRSLLGVIRVIKSVKRSLYSFSIIQRPYLMDSQS